MARKQSATLKVATDDFLSVGKAAKVLGTSRWSVYRWIEAQKIIAIQLGGILFIPKSEINRLQRGNDVEKAPPKTSNSNSEL